MGSKLTEETQTAAALRRWLLVLLSAGIVVTVADLLLPGHFEDAAQWIPLSGVPARVLPGSITAHGNASRAILRSR